MRSGRNTVFVIAFLIIATLPALASRTVLRYDVADRVIKACVLGIGGQTVSSHPNTYLIEGMRRSQLAPEGWVFENPLAPPTVADGGAVDYVGRGSRDYWYVQLTDSTADRLAGMDFIYIADTDPSTRGTMTPTQQEGLLAAVEAGALLWIDGFRLGDDLLNDLGPFSVRYDTFGATGFVRVPADRSHSLLLTPYALDQTAVARLGDLPDRAAFEAGEWTAPGNFLEDLSGHFAPVVEVGQLDGDGQIVNREPFVLTTSFGGGNIVITTGRVGLDVSGWVFQREGGGDWLSAPNYLQAPDVKLALNMIQWNNRWQQARGTPRASATSIVRVPGPLSIDWQYPSRDDNLADEAIGGIVSSPVYGRGMVYVVSLPNSGAEAQLMWFDARPGRDLSGEPGAPVPVDDGILDFARGRPYDMIHRVALSDGHGGSPLMTPRFAAPTLASYRTPGGVLYPHVVLVSYVDANSGRAWVDCYDATVQHDADGDLINPPVRLWRREIQAYNPGVSQSVAISTPVVHNGFVYVLSSERDATLPGAELDRVYGRVHSFELNYPWAAGTPWPADAAWWVYPSHVADIDGDLSAPAQAEDQRLLPPFHLREWVATGVDVEHLPPSPGSIPVVHAGVAGIDGARVDAAITFGTASSHRWDGANIVWDTSVGGSQFTLIPAPMRRSDGLYALNADYFIVRANQVIDTHTATSLAVDPTVMQPVAVQWDEDYVRYGPGAVREAIVEAVLRDENPLEAQLGVDVLVSYLPDGGPAVEGETHRLPGPVRWQKVLPFGQGVAQPSVAISDEIVVSAGQVRTPPIPGSIRQLDAGSGEVKWSYDPVHSIPGFTGTDVGVTAAAVDAESIVAGLYGSTASSLVGLHRTVDVSVDLIGQPNDGDLPVAVTLVGTGEIISPSSYRVEPWLRRLTFPAAGADDVALITGASIGPIYGRAIQIEWPDGSLEDRVLPGIERFHHTAGYIRLRNYPVDMGSVVMTRPDGTLVSGYTALGTVAAFGEGFPGAPLPNCSLDGWIDMRTAVDANGVPVEPGDRVRVSYRGWIERDFSGNGLPEGFSMIPNPDWNLPTETHQMAMQFGPLSPPVVAGDTMHMGYEPAPGYDSEETLVSLMWDRATGFVQSQLTRPAARQTGVAGGLHVLSPPALAEGSVLVSVRTQQPVPDSHGYVSSLRPWGVLIADSNRIIETTGSQPSWVATGSTSPQRAQSFIGEDLRRPFNRPAKAMNLPSGNVLVVDTGNHRVVEIDRAGRVVWPLDRYGYEYYTSPDNRNLKLSRPVDAHRYYSYEGGFPVMHTVIADTGNARVISITTRSRFQEDGNWVYGSQEHTVETVSPAYVQIRGGRGQERVRYTSAQPIFDPVNHEVVGYLCAAGNLNQLIVIEAGTRRVNPPANDPVGGGTTGATWAQWAWLYDHAEDVAVPIPEAERRYVSGEGLQFESIKDANYRRLGDTIYVTVTAGRYIGREGFLYCNDPGCLLRRSAARYNPGAPCPDCPDSQLQRNHHMAAAGAGVFEFRIDVSGAPDTWRLTQTGQHDQPNWYFVQRYVTPEGVVRADYSGTMTEIVAEGQTFSKQWYPVSAQRLPSGRHLIVNSLSHVESATPGNVGDPSAVLGAHIFELETTAVGPHDHNHTLIEERSIPAPGELWADPFTQPAHAEIR